MPSTDSTKKTKKKNVKALTATLIASFKPQEKPYEIRDKKLTGLIARVQPTGRVTYICQYGRGNRITLGRANVLTPAQARDKAREILVDVSRGIDPMTAKRKTKADTFSSYILNVYAPWAHTHHNNGEATIKMLKAHFFPLFGKCKLDEITSWNVEKWRSQRIKDGIKPATLNRYANNLKAALARAVDWGHIKENPLITVKPLKIDRAPNVRFLSDDEESRLRAVLGAREERIRQDRASANQWRAERGYKLLSDITGDYLKPMVLLSINTGLRRGELFNLEWEHIDIERAMLTVRGQGAKSGQTRHVSLNSEAVETLSTWMKQSTGNLVFPGKNGEKMTNIKTAWRRLLKEAKIANFRFHDLRHHFASRLVMAGIDLNTVRELLGHADIKMTLRYAHLAPAIKAAAVQTIVRRQAPETVVELNKS